MEQKQKKCKGTGKAKGFGCGEMVSFRRWGLCASCMGEFLFGTEQGKEIYEKTRLKAKKKVAENKKPKRKYTKWTDKSMQEMIKYVQSDIVNPYIRLRDIESFGLYDSISGGGNVSDAGHFFNIKNNQKLRFCIQNIHGQSYSHNRDIADPGHINEYKDGLIQRHGQAYFNALERLKIESENWPKLDRIELIKIGKTYEYLAKNKIWCFEHKEFENWKNLINQ